MPIVDNCQQNNEILDGVYHTTFTLKKMTSYCGPCTSNSKESEAFSWCLQCDEALCFTCAESHRGMKISRHHYLADVNAVPREIKFLFEKSCPKHKTLSFEYFCVDHDLLCCKECFSESHRTCKNVPSLDTASNGIKRSQSYKDAGDEILHILQTLDTLSSGHIDNIETIQQEVEIIHDNIIRVKEKLIEKVESLVQPLMEELKQIKDNQVNEMKGNITDIQDASTVSKAHKDAFDFTKDSGSDQQTFLLVHTTKGDINRLQQRVLNLAKTRRHVSLEFCENTTIHSSLIRLGSIQLSQGKPICRPFVPRKLSQCQFQISPSRQISTFTNQGELNIQRMYKNCDIRGMAVSNDGTLLLCDSANRRLVMFNSDGNYESTISTKYNPWDIAIIPGTQSAVISKRDEGCIQFIDIENKTQLQVVNVCRNRSGGLGATTDYILVGGEGKIHFLNLHGQFVKSVDVEFKSAIWYLAPLGNDIVCCSGSIDADVHVINMQNGDNKFYRSENLKTPMKMASDDTGNIYIVGHSSENILRLSPNGGNFSVVLTTKDGIKHPCALCFNKDFTKLYVSNKMGKSVTVFTVNR